jgi:lipopolysaccharide transport system permease protein
MSSITNTLPSVGAEPSRAAVVVRPAGRWPEFALAELWDYRELFWFLVWRDVKVRYRQTLLGVAWVVLQPLITMAVFTVVLGRLVGIPTDGIPYPLFAYTGLLPWLFFSTAVSTGAVCLVGHAALITKVYFPRILLPAAAVAARLVDFAVGSLGLLLLLFIYRVPITIEFALIPFVVLIQLILAIGVAAIFSSLNVRYRDVGFIVPVLLQLGMFVTPVVYRWTLVPARWRWMIMANPLTGIVETYRAALLGWDLPWKPLAVSAIAAVAVLAMALFEIRRSEGALADIV